MSSPGEFGLRKERKDSKTSNWDLLTQSALAFRPVMIFFLMGQFTHIGEQDEDVVEAEAL